MRRFISILAIILLGSSLFTCATQDIASNGSISLLKPDLQKFNYSQGIPFDREQYDSAETIIILGHTTRGASLPGSCSLKEFSPIPGNQGNYNSCFAWASAYAARTIIESQYLNRTDKILTTKMAFSPMYLYNTVRRAINASGDEGAPIISTVIVMENTGLPRRVIFDEYYAANISLTDQQRPFSTPITGQGKLFNSNASAGYRIEQVKNSILNGNPVIIGFFVPPSFR
jgi:hypothetical protein